MKKLIWLLALALTGAACHQQAPATQATAAEAPTSAVVTAAAPVTTPPAAAAPSLPPLFAPGDTLTRPMREVLRQHDLSALWQGDTEGRRNDPTLEGFFGPDHHRFVMVFNEVTRDARRPEQYHVRGKCRYRKNIRPFTGLLTVRQVNDLSRDDFFIAGEGANLPDTAAARTYTARAQLQLTEENQENSGVFEAEAVLDFYAVAEPAKVDYMMRMEGINLSLPTRGSGLLLRGHRLNQTTKQVKDFVVATDVFAAAPDVFEDFEIGERGSEINPKYAKLGWNELWKNEEWWTDGAKSSMSL